MDYVFKIGDGLNFGLKSAKNVNFGVTAGSSGNTGSAVLPDNVMTGDTVRHVEAVTKEQYNAMIREKNTLYIIVD